MVNEHKKVVLEQLARIDDIKFKMIKSLLNKELHLTDKMQEDYDIIKIANMLEEKFPKDAGVSKLIEVCKNMPLLTTLADRFKEERTKVQNQNKRKSNAAQRKRKQGEPNTSQPESIRDASSKDTPSLKKKKDKTMETEGLEKGKLTQKQNQPSKPAERNTQKREDAAQIPPMTPPTTPSNSAIKKKRKETITTEDFKKMKLTQEQNQLPEPSVTNAMKTEDSHQTLHMPLPISPSNFLTKENSIKNFSDIKENMLFQWGQFATTSATSIDFAESQVQTPPKLPPNASRHSSSKSPQVPPATLSLGIQVGQVPPVKASSILPAPPVPPSTTSWLFPTVSNGLQTFQRIPCAVPSNLSPLVTTVTSLMNQRPPVQTQVGTRITALQRNSITVKVLKATEVFEYESSGWGTNKMFHATVATERQFFHVKVFNINLKEMFSKNNVIIISNYIECKGILEINEASCVLQAGPDQKIEVPNHVIRRANGTPKIDDLLKLAPGTMVYGLFQLHKKKVNPKTTIYEIQDNTGKMEVVGTGKWHNIKCEEGAELRLFCFRIKTVAKQLKLVCVNHSFIKVR